MRCGVDNYLVNPVTAAQVLSRSADATSSASACAMSLHRAVHEFLKQSVNCHGSLAATARALRVDRRSLRRMLAKNPPLQ